MVRVRAVADRVGALVARRGAPRPSKRIAIAVLYVCFGAILVASGLSTRSIGIAIGAPFLVLGAWALRPTGGRQ